MASGGVGPWSTGFFSFLPTYVAPQIAGILGSEKLTTQAERKWRDAVKNANIKSGCRTLMFFAAVLTVRLIRDMYLQFESRPDHENGCMNITKDWEIWVRATVEILLFAFSAWVFRDCLRNPRIHVYLPMVCLWYLFMSWLGLPPFSPSCGRYEMVLVQERLSGCPNPSKVAMEAVRNVNCTMQGPNILQILVTWILTSHRFLARYHMMRLNWLYIFGIFFPMTVIVQQVAEHGENTRYKLYGPVDIFFSIVLLSICQLISTARKYYLEKSERNKYVTEFKQSKATKKIFNILRFMVPLHVVKPLLLHPQETIADPVDCVSILFIMILDFDEKARRMSAEKLLNFLNENFEAWDQACAKHGVTKIETVREEYVCAVGVVPSDIDAGKAEGCPLGHKLEPWSFPPTHDKCAICSEAQSQGAPSRSCHHCDYHVCGKCKGKEVGHQAVLARLILVASDILKMQCADVQVKMGMHTGPIVAGVIGHKLPRFRLFGDTINTSARMMQKGLSGELQFGEQTKQLLPDWVGVKQRGEIEMKGKGKVMAYLLDRSSPRLQEDDFPGALEGGGGRQQRLSVLEMLASSGTFGSAAGVDPSGSDAALPRETEPTGVEALASGQGGSMVSVADAGDGGSARGQTPLSAKAHKKRHIKPHVRFGDKAEVAEPADAAQGRLQESDDEEDGSDVDDEHPAHRKKNGITRQTSEDDIREDEAHTKEFDDLVRLLAKARDSQQTGWRKWASCGLRTNFFTDDLEREWYQYHHESRLCHKLVARLDRHAVVLVLTTAWDTFFFVLNYHKIKVPFSPHMLYGQEGQLRTLRLFVFLACRLTCFGLVWLWQREARSDARMPTGEIALGRDGWLTTKAYKAQRLLMLTYCAIAMLFFISYDAVSNVSKDLTVDLPWPDPMDPRNGENFTLVELIQQDLAVKLQEHTRATGVNLFLFFIAFYVITTELPFPFGLNIPFFMISWLAVQVSSLGFWEDAEGNSQFSLFWSATGQWNFLVVAFLNLATAYSFEWNSRSRFKAMKNLDKMHGRAHDILKKLMPPLVVEEIRDLPAHAPPPSHLYRRATIAQSDLSGFTKLSSTRTPQQVVQFMSDLFGRFDILTDKRNVWKVETVGDAYIAGQAEAPLTLKNSSVSVVMFGFDMVKAVQEWAVDLGVTVTCRVGVASGSCVGGIVGTVSQRYHLFGDLMNVVEVLEATGIESRVHISKACKEEVERQLREEGPVDGELEILGFEHRQEAHLETSKGEVHHYDEVGGKSYLVNFRTPFAALTA